MDFAFLTTEELLGVEADLVWELNRREEQIETNRNPKSIILYGSHESLCRKYVEAKLTLDAVRAALKHRNA